MDDLTSRDDEKRLELAQEQGRAKGPEEERARENARVSRNEGGGTGVTIIVSLIVLAIIVFAGCTSSSQPVQTPSPANTVVIPSPTLTAVPFPDALGLDQFAWFGGTNGQGSATVYRYEIRPHYNWTSSSWNSPREQAAASQPMELQSGFNMEKPGEGNTFLFIFIRVKYIGTQAIHAPSGEEFVVYSDGKMYNYSPVHSSDVLIDKVSGTQYNNQIGQAGTHGGTLWDTPPSESNLADGYLIYEIPASFSPNTTYVVGNLDYQNQAAWNLGNLGC
jgi:hypothetical protein